MSQVDKKAIFKNIGSQFEFVKLETLFQTVLPPPKCVYRRGLKKQEHRKWPKMVIMTLNISQGLEMKWAYLSNSLIRLLIGFMSKIGYNTYHLKTVFKELPFIAIVSEKSFALDFWRRVFFRLMSKCMRKNITLAVGYTIGKLYSTTIFFSRKMFDQMIKAIVLELLSGSIRPLISGKFG